MKSTKKDGILLLVTQLGQWNKERFSHVDVLRESKSQLLRGKSVPTITGRD